MLTRKHLTICGITLVCNVISLLFYNYLALNTPLAATLYFACIIVLNVSASIILVSKLNISCVPSELPSVQPPLKEGNTTVKHRKETELLHNRKKKSDSTRLQAQSPIPPLEDVSISIMDCF